MHRRTTPHRRRAGAMATATLGLALFGAVVATRAGAAPPLYCNGQMITDQVVNGLFVGSAQAEVIGGTNGADRIIGGGGNDTICGWGGNDEIDGGENTDGISGGPDNDVINGAGLGDELYGNDGEDVLNGDDGDDILRAGDDDDILNGGDDDDVLHCGLGTDDEAHGDNHVTGDSLVSVLNHGCEALDTVNP